MTSLSLPPRWLAAIIAVAACSGPGPGASPDAAGPDAAGPDAADPDAAMDAALDAAVDAAPDAPDPVPMPLDLELGHQAGVTSIQRTATRVLTVDPGHHWALWDPTTRALIAKGDRACPVSQGCQEPAALLAGDTVLIRGVPTLEVRSATTGQVLAAIPSQVGLDTPGSGIASDGSYVWANTTAWVRAWSPTGVNRVDVAGNYLASKPAGAPGELRIGAGPAGVGRLERIDVATGARTTALHDGTFLAWSSDGARFVTTTGNLVRVYDGTGALVSSGVLPTLTELGTRGDRLWVRSHPGPDDALDVYPASNLAATPTRITITNGATVVDTPEALGVLFPTGGSLDAISLATLAVTHVGGLPCGLTTFAGGASGWLVGTAGGAVLTGAGSSLGPPLARGKLTSISGTVGGLAAIASAAGIVELVAVSDTPMVVRTLPYRSSRVELSTDGATLVVADDLASGGCQPALPLRVIATASGAVLHQWPYPTTATSQLVDIGVARSALVIAHYLYDATARTYTRLLTTAAGATLPSYGPPITVDVFTGMGGLLAFAPAGQRAASHPAYASLDQAFTYLYDGGVQRAIVDGVERGWLDDDRVLIARYVRAGSQTVLSSTTVRSVDGTVVATPPLPELAGAITPVGLGQLYAPGRNVVYDATTGAAVWTGPPAWSASARQAAGDHVLYVSGTALVVERFRP